MLLRDASWNDINELRMSESRPSSVEAGAREFLDAFVTRFESIVLARVFIVLPYGVLPAQERSIADRTFAAGSTPRSEMPCLTLLATRGREDAWNDRTKSLRHRVIPLLNRESVRSAPMVAKLLADFQVELRELDNGLELELRRMAGGQNATFYVADAPAARDEYGRSIIADQRFVEMHSIRTVFGMGGAYVDGTLAITIVFTEELLDRLIVDRYPSLIANFKMATGPLLPLGRIFDAS